MSTKVMALLLVGALLALGVSWQAAVIADLQAERSTELTTVARGDVEMETDGVEAYLGDPVFAQRVAGSYLINFLLTNPYTGALEGSGNGLIQLQADGTFVFVSDNMQGTLGAAIGWHSTPWLGTWERSGRRQVKWQMIGFAKDIEAKTTQFIARQEAKINFSDDFATLEAQFFTRLLLPGAPTGAFGSMGKFFFTACERFDCEDSEDPTGCCECCAMRDCVRDTCHRDPMTGECLDPQPPGPPPCLRGLYIPDETSECIIAGNETGICLEWCVERSGGLFAECDRTANTTDEDRNGVEDSLECLLFPANPNAAPDECAWLGPYGGYFAGARMEVLPEDWNPWDE